MISETQFTDKKMIISTDSFFSQQVSDKRDETECPFQSGSSPLGQVTAGSANMWGLKSL